MSEEYKRNYNIFKLCLGKNNHWSDKVGYEIYRKKETKCFSSNYDKVNVSYRCPYRLEHIISKNKTSISFKIRMKYLRMSLNDFYTKLNTAVILFIAFSFMFCLMYPLIVISENTNIQEKLEIKAKYVNIIDYKRIDEFMENNTQASDFRLAILEEIILKMKNNSDKQYNNDMVQLSFKRKEMTNE